MTSEKQPEALRLVDVLIDDKWGTHINRFDVCEELRRQHAQIVELESQLKSIGAGGVTRLVAGIDAEPGEALRLAGKFIAHHHFQISGREFLAGDVPTKEQVLNAIAAALALPQVGVLPKRCNSCNYQHGHAIGCSNNPVDMALRAIARAPDMPVMPAIAPEPVKLTMKEIAACIPTVEIKGNGKIKQMPMVWLTQKDAYEAILNAERAINAKKNTP